MKNKLLSNLKLIFLFGCFSAIHSVSFAQSPPTLGTTSSFALFTAVGAFDNIGNNTYVTGDIGTHVGAFTGFPPGTVVGQIQVANPASAQAAVDVDVAYTALSATTCGVVIGTTLGNSQVLTPDVYCLGAASSLNGDLILDAEGNPDALFIIKIDGALSTSTFSNVVLINSASLCNVYWQINGAFELGDNSVFRGTIVANGAISLLEGSTLLGRGLSRGGAIDLHNNLVAIGMHPIATITAGSATTFCPGGSVTLSAAASNGIAPFSYLWSQGGQTNSSITVSPTTTTPFIVAISALNGCSIALDTIQVTIKNPDTADAGINQVACPGDVITLAGYIGGSATGGTWSGGTGTFSPDNTTLNADYTPGTADITAGSVVLTLTTFGGCSPASDQVTVTINTMATVNAGTDQFACPGTVITLAGSIGGSATGGTWSGGTGTFSPDNTTLNAVYTPGSADITAGSVVLILTTSGDCSPASDQVTITINASATVNAGTDQVICPGLGITLAGSVGGSATGGTWSGGTGTFSPNDSTLNAVYTPGAADITAGSVVLTLTTYGGCSTASDQLTITINASATANAGIDQVICPGIGITLAGSIGGPATGGTWSGGTGTFSPNDSTLNAVYTASTAEITAGSVVLTLTTFGGLCPASDQATITITNPVVDLGPDTTVCGCILLYAGNIGSTFDWSNGTDYSTVNICTSGSYWVKVSNGTCYTYDSINIIVNALPIVNLGNDTTFTGTIVLNAGNTGSAYIWNTGSTNQSVTVDSSGTYYVSVTNTLGCTSSDTINITILTGVDVIFNEHAVKLYPNPSAGVFTFEIEGIQNASVRVTNLLGKTVHSEKINNQSTIININGVTNGIYFIEIQVDGKIYFKKIVKE